MAENEKKPEQNRAEDIIRKHIEDPGHRVTDEEIRNVPVGESDHTPVVGAEMLSRMQQREEAGIEESKPKTNEAVGDAGGEEEEGGEPTGRKKLPDPWDVVD